MVQVRVLVALILIIAIVIILYIVGSNGSGIYLNEHKTSASSSVYTSSSAATTQKTTIASTTTAAQQSSMQPEVRITSPQNLSTVNGVVNITANVTNGVALRQVQFYIDDNLSSTSTSAPYYYMWNTTGLTKPEYIITVEAYGYGNVTANASILVDVGLVQHGK